VFSEVFKWSKGGDLLPGIHAVGKEDKPVFLSESLVAAAPRGVAHGDSGHRWVLLNSL